MFNAQRANKRKERAFLVTVMIDKFFGVHPYVTRSGLWAKMKPGAKDLYIYLMAESERNCTREMKRTDAVITLAVGVSGRTLCNARKKLQEFGLILCKKGEGNKYNYVICDPLTHQPYPGDPRVSITCAKRGRAAESPSSGDKQVAGGVAVGAAIRYGDKGCIEQHGISGVFHS